MTQSRNPEIELVYFSGCPHVEQARQSLRDALNSSVAGSGWVEWDQLDPGAPTRIQGFGSPTILIDGADVTGLGRGNTGKACRADGVPTPAAIRVAIDKLKQREETGGGR